MLYTVYMHITPNGKRYVGLTKLKPEKRWGKNGSGYHNNIAFYNAILEYGWGNIEHLIIGENLTQESGMILERNLIREYGTTDPRLGYNQYSGKELGEWKYLSDKEYDIKEKRREKWIKSLNERNVKHRKPVIKLETGEVYESITSAALAINRAKKRLSYCVNRGIGYHGHWEFVPTDYSDEWRLRRLKERTERPKKEPYVNPNGYHKWSDEAKQSNKGKNGKAVIQMTLGGQDIAEFASSVIAGETLGINHRKIRMVCNGERKKCGGFRWRWKETESA